MFTALLRHLLGRPRGGAVRPADAHVLSHEGPAVLLDVRDDQEWRAGHAPQAWHIPLRMLEERISALPRDLPIVTVCRSGRRSGFAADLLHRRGYDAHKVEGGMAAWSEAGLPVVTPEPGEPVWS